MAQELIKRIWCDLHLGDDGNKEDAQTWTFTITSPDVGAPVTFEIDLCDTCGKPHRDLLAELVEYGREQARRGRPPVSAGSSSDSTPHPCPVSGCGYVGSSNKALHSHAKHIHDGKTIAELDGSATLPCTVPGCGRMFGRKQGLIMHLTNAHPDALAELETARQLPVKASEPSPA